MTLNYNGTDLSGYITKYGYVETPRIVEGPNAGTAMDGSDIPDVVAVKRDLTVTLRPLTEAQVTVIWNLSAASTTAYHTLNYTSANGSTRSIQARLEIGGATKIMETSEKTLYDGIEITFKEK